MDFVKQIDESMTKETTHTDDEPESQEKQTELPDNAESPSPDFSNLTTDVGDNPYIRRLPPIESPAIPTRSPPTVDGYNPRKVAKCILRPNPKPDANPDFRPLDAMLSTH